MPNVFDAHKALRLYLLWSSPGNLLLRHDVSEKVET